VDGRASPHTRFGGGFIFFFAFGVCQIYPAAVCLFVQSALGALAASLDANQAFLSYVLAQNNTSFPSQYPWFEIAQIIPLR
jgi:hypothetical protein